MAPWTEGDVAAGDVRIHYYRTGNGDKPALVLLHGITDSGLCWSPVARALEGDYDIIMVDARGHGRSDAPDAGYATGDHAADVIALLDALALTRPTLMGHSMGASNAAAVAARIPERVACLVLEDPPWRPASERNTPEQNAAFADQWRAGLLADKALGRDELLAVQRTRTPGWPEGELDPWADAKAAVSPNVLGYVSAESFDWRAALPRVDAPLLLITGETAIVGDEVTQEVRRLAPHAQVAHIPGAGHSIRRDQPEAYLAAVRAFLREHAR
jgi:pimeloyl-ACP methyl ester carboxylesterase